jgi:hypothetical protein
MTHPRPSPIALFAVAASLLCVTPLLAGSLLASEREPVHQRIDRLLAASHPQFASFAAPRSSDAEFHRRIHLDLVGSIPTAEQTRAFLNDNTTTSEKRERLINRLLADPRHARRMQYVFDEMLMARLPATNIPDAEWRNYLRQSFLVNKPWNQLVLEILSADGADPQLRPAARFYLDRDFDVDRLTRDIGRVFLGVDLECAQCHDHPAIDGYLQRHYYGISAFLQRSYVFTNPKNKQKQLGEKAEGDVTFTSVFTDETSQTDPRLLDLPAIADPSESAKQYLVKPDKKSRGVPQYSRRLKLAQAMVSADNIDFRRNIVNRLWAVMLGRGLVEPLDVRHAENPPSHPAVLKLLAEEFLRHDYDIRWLIKQLALTEAYQRGSFTAEAQRETAAKHYAVALLKPQSPEQLAWSIMQASGAADAALAAKEAALLKSDPKFGAGRKAHPLWREEALHDALKVNIDQFAAKFAGQNGQTTSFGATANQALFLMNDPLVERWLLPANNNLTDRLQKLTEPTALADELYLSVLCRKPTAAEIAEVTDYFQTVGDRNAGIQEFVWALLSSSEFRFNH